MGLFVARLFHHLPDGGECEKLLSELLKAARKFVVFSFADRRSIKLLRHILQGNPLNSCAMAVQEIADIADGHGARVCSLMTVSHIGPHHQFALLQKQ